MIERVINNGRPSSGDVVECYKPTTTTNADINVSLTVFIADGDSPMKNV